MTKFARLLGMITILLCLQILTYGQGNIDLSVGLNELIVPFKHDSAKFEISENQKIGSSIADKQIIALGEATHGTREFFIFKAGLCRYLIEELGFKTIVLESDFAGTQRMNEFIVNGTGSAEDSIWKMGFSGNTQEFLDFCNWVRTYNENKDVKEKVVFYGCDMQYPNFAATIIKEYLAKRNMINPEISRGFDAFGKYIPGLSREDKNIIQKTVSYLETMDFADQEPDMRSLYLHNVKVLRQFVSFLGESSAIFPTRQSDSRDKFMAANCQWIYNHSNKGKMVIWAHNEHIKKSKGSDGHFRMGIGLAEVFKDDYYAVCLDFYKGSMRSFDNNLKKTVSVELPIGKAGSTGEIFSHCKAPSFFLDFKSAEKNKQVFTMLNSNIASVWYGAHFQSGQKPYYATNKLADAYDAVVFFKQTTAASNIKK